MPEIIDFEKIKKESQAKENRPVTEEEIKADIRVSLSFSPFFEKMTPQEQQDLINEMYERHYKEEKKAA